MLSYNLLKVRGGVGGGGFRWRTPTGSDLGQVASLKPLYKLGVMVTPAS